MRGLPFAHPERIVAVQRTNPSRGIDRMGVTIHDFADWRAQQRSFTGLAAYYSGTINLSGTEKAERYDGAFMSADAFRLLGARPMLGRTFSDGEDAPGAEPVIILGHAVWRDRYASDPGVIGTTIRVNGVASTVVGVMPEGFAFPESQEVWVPLRLNPLAIPRGEGQQLNVYGRLRPGVSLDQAQVELAAVARRLATEHPRTNEGVGVQILPYTEAFIGDEPTAMLYTMLGAVFFVLLIACANVANLLLGRAAHRAREVGIRTALGASRAAVVRQFLLESAILCATGAAIGLGIAYAGIAMFNRAIVDTGPPFWIDIKLDLTLVLFVAGVALLSALASGLLPAVQASRADINEILKDESRGSSSFRVGRMSRALVVLEVALSCGLLVGAGLMIKSVTKLRTVDFGFTVDDVFTARVGLPEGTRYTSDTTQRQFFEQVLQKVEAIPGIGPVALTSRLPAMGSGIESFAVEGAAYAESRDLPRARWVAVSPGFFQLYGGGVLQGRNFGEQDRQGSLPVAIVNRSFARKHFGGASPVGRRIRTGDLATREPWLTIVGVVPDLFAGEPDNKEPEAIYRPVAQAPQRFLTVAARPRGEPMAIAPLVRDAVAAVDADIPIYFVQTHARAIARETWFYRVFGTIFMVFGFVALFLAAIGLYAVMAHSVGRRIREMGVRMALGAQAGDVVGLVLRQGLLQIAAGLVLGLALAAGVSSLLSMLLFGVTPRDPAIFGAVVLVLVATGLAACLLPARRATRVSPMVALRAE
jgi:predicted permease